MDTGRAMTRLLLPLVFAASFAAAPAAQTAPPQGAAPVAPAATTASAVDAPHMRITTLGPQGWRIRLGPTNVGLLLDSEAGRALWGDYATAMSAAVGGLFEVEADWLAAQRSFLDYDGTIHIAAWFDDDAARDGLRAAWLVAEADGHTDMQKLATALHVLQDQTPGEWDEATVGETRMRVRKGPFSSMSEARVVDGHLVLAVTRAETEPLAALHRAAGAVLANAPTRAPHRQADRRALAEAAQKPPLVVEFAPAAMLTSMGMSKDDTAVWSLSGAEGLRDVALTLTSAGPHIVMEAAASFADAPTGLFRVLTAPRATLPKLVRALPAGAPTFRLGHFDFAAMWDFFVGVMAAERETTTEAMAKELATDLGVDLGDGFFRLLGDEVLMTTKPVDDPDRPAKATWAVTIAVKDGARFAPALQALIDALKPNITRLETETIGGVACSRYGNILNYPLWLGAGARGFYLAGGSEAEDELAALIAAVETAPADAATPTAIDAAFDGLRRALPAGMSGASRYDLQHGSVVYDALFAGFGGMLLGNPFFDGAEFDPEAAAAAKEAWLERLRANNLATVRTATGYANATWRFRLYW